MNRAWVLLAGAVLLTYNFTLAQTTPTTPPATKPPAAKPGTPILKVPAGSKPATPQATAPKATPPASKTPAAVTKTSTPLQPAVAKTSAGGAQAAVPLQPASMVQTMQNAQPSQLGSGASQLPTVPANNSTGAANNYAGAPVAAGNNYANGSAAPSQSAPGASVGSFIWPGGWTLTSYGCFRADTRMFCDFDTSNPNNLQANTSIWSAAGGVNLVDDGGKITQRSTAFFVGTDGSTFQTAYISQQPVRFVIEYDNVSPRVNSVSLVLTNNRIQAVPVRAMDPSQPAGTIPPR